MSAAPRKKAAHMQDHQRKVEDNEARSALCYLFHEVSKLAAPIHDSLFDTNPPSRKPSEALHRNICRSEKGEQTVFSSSEDPSVVKDTDGHLFQSSCSSRRHSLCCVIPCSRVRSGMEEGQSSNASTLCESRGEWDSPWKVLSLINLHCERLLHEKDVDEPGFSLGSSSSRRVSPMNATFATLRPVVTEEGNTEDSLESTSGPTLQLYERQSSASASTVEDLQMVRTEEPLPNSKSCRGVIHAAEKTASCCIALYKCRSAISLHPPKCFRDKPNVCKELELIQEGKNDNLRVPFPENALQQMSIPSICSNTQIALTSTYIDCKDVEKPALTMDHNANFTLSTEQPSNTQLPPSADLLSSQSGSQILNKAAIQSLSPSKAECCRNIQQENHHGGDYSTASSGDLLSATSPELWMVSNDEKYHISSTKYRAKSRRKQPHPSRSADSRDPDFQGVTFRIDTELDDKRQQCRLLITSKYSKELCKSGRKHKLRTRTSLKLTKTSSSDEEDDHAFNVNKSKACASCCTRKTPMWRDAEDGTPLCNACGIRYKKYRVRCVKCWHIPRKEGNSSSLCIRCGNFVKLSSAQRKHPS